ncbi:serine hydrolase domain-containing protein [Brevibacillus fluminis]|nr:serine hydrolase domain-containing protein [Brevibacillus fluminis]
MEEKIDKLFTRWKEDTAGGYVAIRSKGELVFEKAYGLADMENKIPVTKSTLFHIASTSKQFTCFCILLLEESGLLDIDDDVKKYIPGLMPYECSITIRQLMNHTSGIRELYNLYSFGGLLFDDISTNEHIRNYTKRLRTLSFKPGSDFSYCNTGYFLLSEIVTAVTKESIREFARKNIFDPLDMKDTFWLDDYTEIVPNMSQCYYDDGQGKWKKAFVSSEVVGSSGIISNPADLLKWTAHYLAPIICKPETLRKMQESGVLDNRTETGYGMGLYVSKTHSGLRYFEHSGSTGAYRAALMVFPEAELELIITANNAAVDLNQACFTIASIISGQNCTPTNYGGNIPSLPEPKLLDYSGNAEGRYVILDSYVVELKKQGDGYQLLTPRETFPMEHVEKNKYVAPQMGYHFFLFDGYILINALGKTIRSDKLNTITLEPERIHELCGLYYCHETNGVFEVEATMGGILLRHARLGVFTCIAKSDSEFICLFESLCTLSFRNNSFELSAARTRGLLFRKIGSERNGNKSEYLECNP